MVAMKTFAGSVVLISPALSREDEATFSARARPRRSRVRRAGRIVRIEDFRGRREALTAAGVADDADWR
jgi:hypothetical protein